MDFSPEGRTIARLPQGPLASRSLNTPPPGSGRHPRPAQGGAHARAKETDSGHGSFCLPDAQQWLPHVPWLHERPTGRRNGLCKVNTFLLLIIGHTSKEEDKVYMVFNDRGVLADKKAQSLTKDLGWRLWPFGR